MAHRLPQKPDGDAPASAVPVTLSAGRTVASAELRAATRFEVLRAYEQHKAQLFAFLVSATRDGELAADLLQESFVRLLREAETHSAPLDTRAWLFRVAGNLVVSAARRRRTVKRWASWLAVRESEASPEQQYLRREDADRVHAALARLRGDDRVALLMAAHGCPISEIAPALRRSELATRSLLCRARVKLRDQVATEETTR